MRSSGSKVPTILVIDSIDQTEWIRLEVASLQFEVAGCQSFAESLKKCQKSHYSVAVLDPGPGTQCGMESVAELLQTDPSIRVIVHTSGASKDDVKVALHCGAFAFVEKEQSENSELLGQIHRAIDTRKPSGESLTEKGLLESERIQLLFHSTFQLIGLLSADGIVLEANESALEFGGIRATDVLQRPFWEAAWFKGLDAEVETLKAAIERAANGEFVRYTMQAHGVDGIETLDFSLKPVFDEQGNVKLLVPEGRLVTEQERAKKALQRSEEKYRSLVEHAPFCIHEIDTEGNLLSMNRAGLELMGLAHEAEVIGLDFLKAVSLNDRARVSQLLNGVLAGSSSHFAFQTPRNQHFESCLVPIKNERGETLRIMGITQDMTERVRSEERLRLSEARARAIFDQAAVGVALIDSATGTIRHFNRRYWEILGFDSGLEVTGLSWMDLTHPDDLDADLFNMQRMRKGEIRKFAIEKRLKCRDGSYVWVNLTVSPTWQPGESPSIHIAIIEDISERKLTQKKLQFTQFSVDSCCHPIFWIRQDASFFYVNEAVSRDLGYSEDEMLSMTVHDIDPSYSTDRWQEYWDAMRRQHSIIFETRIRHKDGRMIPVEISTNLLEFENREFVFAFVSDITARKNSERALEFQADLLNRVSDAVLVSEQQGKVTYANDAAKRLFSDDSSSFPNLTERILDGMTGSGGRETKIVDSLELSGYWHGECEISINNQTRSFDTHVNSFKALEERDPFLLFVLRDVSARKHAEQEIREHSQMLAHMTRLNTMGELLAGIAHEVKQPLYAVANFATAAAVTLDNMTSESRVTHDWLNEMKGWNEGVRNAAQRASDIIRRSRDFAKKGEQRRELIDVPGIIDDSIRLIAFEARMNETKVTTEIELDLPNFYAERIQCEQVLVNLLHNAVEILNDVDRPRIIVVRASKIGKFVEFQVEDSGPGIADGERGKIFEAFHTAKPGGMGLGLAISRTIVQDHDGKIWTSKGKLGGAVFHFILPIANSEDSETIK